MARITICVDTNDPEILYEALEAEIVSSPFSKSRTEIKKGDFKLTIDMESDSLPALRGTFNSVMNWLRIILLGTK